MGGGNIIREA